MKLFERERVQTDSGFDVSNMQLSPRVQTKKWGSTLVLTIKNKKRE